MAQGSLIYKQVANTIKNSALYPAAKTIYKNTLNRKYLVQRKKMLDFFGDFVHSGDLVFDIGANVGDFTDVFLRLGARVCAVEANPECIRQFKALYGNHRHCTLIAKAIGSAEGKGKMYLGEQGMHNVSTLSEAWKNAALKIDGLRRAGWNHTVEVDVLTIDQMIQKYGVPAFCKIDVEGFEYEVLQRLNQPLPCLSFEYVSWQLDPTIQCIKHLGNLGTYQYNMTINRTARDTDIGEFQCKDWLNENQMIELLEQEVRDAEMAGDLYARLISHS